MSHDSGRGGHAHDEEPSLQDDEVVAAYHEAGHAVATVMMRRSLRKATIVPEEDSRGHVLHGPLSKGFSSRLEEASYQGPGGVMDASMRRLVEREVIICLAGPIAQRLAAGDEAAVEAGGGVVELDEEESRALSQKFGVDISSMLLHGGDYHTAFELLLTVTAGDDDEAAAWEGWLRIRAERLVSRYWNQITAVAEALRNRKTLSGSEVRQIVSDSFPGF